MVKRIIRWLDPILVIGLLLSSTVGIGLVLIGNDAVSSLIVGLLVTTITLLIDISARIQKAESVYIETARLSHVLSDQPMSHKLQEIANIYESIGRYGFDYYYTLALDAIADCKPRLLEIASGSVRVPIPSTHEYHGIEQARGSIKALHIIPMDFWVSDFGRTFFEKNRKARKRGINVTRVFSLTTEATKNSIAILREHERAGINVFIVKPSERTRQEFTIIDDITLIVHETDGNHRYVADHIIRDPEQVQRKIAEFDNLISLGKSLKQVAGGS